MTNGIATKADHATWMDGIRAAARKRWGRHAKKWIWGQFILIWGLAQLLPVDILDRLPFLSSVCAPIVRVIPYISGYIGRSAFPQVTELIICLGWLIALLNVVFGVLFPEYLFRTKPKVVFGDLRNLKPTDAGFSGFFLAPASKQASASGSCRSTTPISPCS